MALKTRFLCQPEKILVAPRQGLVCRLCGISTKSTNGRKKNKSYENLARTKVSERYLGFH